MRYWDRVGIFPEGQARQDLRGEIIGYRATPWSAQLAMVGLGVTEANDLPYSGRRSSSSFFVAIAQRSEVSGRCCAVLPSLTMCLWLVAWAGSARSRERGESRIFKKAFRRLTWC